MKKYFFIFLTAAIMPGLTFGASARYTQLVREKQNKMAELEKCQGKNKGLKIAGISTLGLTAVGVAGNVVEAKKRNENEKAIDKLDTKIESAEKEISEKQNKIAEQEAKKAAEKAEAARKQAEAEMKKTGADVYCKKQLANVQHKGTMALDEKGECIITSCEEGFTPSDDKKNCVEVSKTNAKEGTDCTEQMKKTVEQVVKAEINAEGKCEVKECKKPYLVSINKDNCDFDGGELKQDDEVTCSREELNQLYALYGKKVKGKCNVQECVDGYHLEANGKTYSPDEYSGMLDWIDDMKCVEDKAGNKEENKDGVSSGMDIPKDMPGTIPFANVEMPVPNATIKGINGELKPLEVTVAPAATAPTQPANTSVNKKPATTTKTATKTTEPKTATDNKPKVPEFKESDWDDKKKKSHPDAYCSAKYGNYNDTLGYNCCLAIHKTNGHGNKYYTGSRCECKDGYEWKGTACVKKQVENENFFQNTNVNVRTAIELVKLWGRKNGKNLTYVKGSESVHKFGQDFISFESDSGIYKFEFGDLSENIPGRRFKDTGEAVCRIMGGNFNEDGWFECTGVNCGTWKKTVKDITTLYAPDYDDGKSGCKMKY